MAKRKYKGTKVAPGVYKLEDRWRIAATIQVDHKKVWREEVITFEEAPSKEDAIIARAELAKRLKRGELKPARATPSQTSVSDYAERWLRQRSPALKHSTTERYIEALGTWILPCLGDVFCDQLNRGDIADWVLWAEAKRKTSGLPYSQSSLDSWWRVLKTFTADLAAEFERPDPCARVRGPRSSLRGVRERRTLSAEQLHALLAFVEEHHPAWLTEITLLAFTGLRAGELYALHMDDVCQDVIKVRRTVYRGRLGTTKTGSPREVALTPALRKLLADHRAQLLRDQHPGLSSGILFPGEHGSYRGSQALLRRLKFISKAMSLPFTVGPQVLRRTFNTLMLEQGVDRAVLRAQMGHTSEQMTQLYAGVRADQKQAAVSDLIRRVQGSE